MAEEEPLLASPPTPEAAHHVRDYERFTSLIKWSGLTLLIVALVLIIFIL